MIIRPSQLFALIWIGWLVSWLAASFWSSRTAKRAASWNARAYRAAIVVGAIMLTPWAGQWLGGARLWDAGYGGAYALAGITLLGILFAWWARIYLGRLWSSAITRKVDHRVVDTGPYALVRHPIYTGLMTAILATAAAAATPAALVGAGLISFGLWLKARAEERFLTAELGPDTYGTYRRRVPMLIPGIRHR